MFLSYTLDSIPLNEHFSAISITVSNQIKFVLQLADRYLKSINFMNNIWFVLNKYYDNYDNTE